MRILLLFFGLFLSIHSFGQTYSYSFSGKIESESGNALTVQCAALPEVHSCKLRYKDNEEKGELILEVNIVKKEGSEGAPDFSPIEVKRILIEMGLSPVSFNKISK